MKLPGRSPYGSDQDEIDNCLCLYFPSYAQSQSINCENYAADYYSPYRFNAKEVDQETGLYYYGARYMDPKTSIWLSVDPKAYAFPSVTPYSVMMNNPVMMIDPGGDSTLFYNANGDLMHTSHDGLENAVVVVGEEGMEGVQGIIQGIEDGTYENSDEMWQNARDHGTAYSVDEWKDATLGNSMRDEISVNGVEGYHPEYKAFGYLEDGMVRPGSDVLRGDEEMVDGSASFSKSVNKGHSHPNADRPVPGEYPYSYAHSPSNPYDYSSEYSGNAYHDMVITPKYIYFINSTLNNFVIPARNTFNSKITNNPWRQ